MAMTTKLMVTANRLLDGRVVYLREDRSWSQRCHEGWVSEDAAAIDAAVASALSHETEIVVEAYRIEVVLDGDRIVHTSARERIRAEGPAAVLHRFGPRRAEPLARVAAR